MCFRSVIIDKKADSKGVATPRILAYRMLVGMLCASTWMQSVVTGERRHLASFQLRLGTLFPVTVGWFLCFRTLCTLVRQGRAETVHKGLQSSFCAVREAGCRRNPGGCGSCQSPWQVERYLSWLVNNNHHHTHVMYEK